MCSFSDRANFILAFLVAMVGIGCGAGHANLTSITVSPRSATTTTDRQGQVGYSADREFRQRQERGAVAGRRSIVENLANKYGYITFGGLRSARLESDLILVNSEKIKASKAGWTIMYPEVC